MQRHFQAGDRGNVMAGAQGGFTDVNYWPEFDGDGNLTGLTIKSGKREGTYVPYAKGPGGTFLPDPSRAFLREYYTNHGEFFELVKNVCRIVDLVYRHANEDKLGPAQMAQPSPQLQDPITEPFRTVPPSKGRFLA